jgi:hypothetical protein
MGEALKILRPGRRVWRRERGLLLPKRGLHSVRPRAGYRNIDSMPVGHHYGGPRGGAARTIFTVVDNFGLNWIVPAGVFSVDILMVGGGAGGTFAVFDSFLGAPGGGGGGGGIVVMNGVVSVPGHLWKIFVGSFGLGGFDDTTDQSGGPSVVRNDTLAIEIGRAGGGASTASTFGPIVGLPDGFPVNGPGGGGVYVPFDGGAIAPGVGDGTGGDGGPGNGVLASYVEIATGGGGGAGGNGTAGIAGAPGNPGVPGNGGPGAVPPPSSFGPWGIDIGEGGIFGGGGWGRNAQAAWARGSRGVGGGAANTGGGSGASAPPANAGDNGFSGIVVLMYVTP